MSRPDGRGEQSHAVRPTVNRRCLDGRPEVVPGRHVYDCVVHEHTVEQPAEPEAPHVSNDVLALRIETLTHGDHVWRHVGQYDLAKGRFHVVRVIAPAAAEFQQGMRTADARPGDLGQVERRLFLVVLWRRQQGPPRRQLRIELHVRGMFTDSQE